MSEKSEETSPADKLQSEDPLHAWLLRLELGHLTQQFHDQAITLELLGDLSEEDLVEAEIGNEDERKKLINAANFLRTDEDPKALEEWLNEHELVSLLPALRDHGFTLQTLLDTSEDDLESANIRPLGLRKRLFVALGKERTGLPQSERVTQTVAQTKQALGQLGARVLAGAKSIRWIALGLVVIALLGVLVTVIIDKMPRTFGPDYPFALSVADLRDRDVAEVTAERLRTLGHRGEVVMTRAVNGSAWYHVLTAHSRDQSSLDEEKKRFDEEGPLGELSVFTHQDWGPSLERLADAGAPKPLPQPHSTKTEPIAHLSAELVRLINLIPASSSHPLKYAAMYLSERPPEEFPYYEGARARTRTDMPRGIKREELLPNLSALIELRYFDPIFDDTVVLHLFKLRRSQVDNSLPILLPVQHFSNRVLATDNYISEKKEDLKVAAISGLVGKKLSIETEAGQFRHYGILFDKSQDLGVFIQARNTGWERGIHLLENLSKGGGFITQPNYAELLAKVPKIPPMGAQLTVLSFAVKSENRLKATAGIPVLTAWFREPFKLNPIDHPKRNRRKREWSYQISIFDQETTAKAALADELYERSRDKKSQSEEIPAAYGEDSAYYFARSRRLLLQRQTTVAQIYSLKKTLSKDQMLDTMSRLGLDDEKGFIRPESQKSALPPEGTDLSDSFEFLPPFCGERPKDGLVGRLLEIWSERAQCELSGGECPTDPVPVAAGFDAVATPAVLYHRKRRNLLSLKTKLKGGFYMGIPLQEITLSAIPGSGSGFNVEITLNEGVKTVKAILTRHRYWQQRIDDSIEMSRGLMGASIKPKGRKKTRISCTL